MSSYESETKPIFAVIAFLQIVPSYIFSTLSLPYITSKNTFSRSHQLQ